MSKANSSALGALLIATAAFLWATDALFRVPAVESLDPTFIVFCEHAIGMIVLSPWPILSGLPGLLKLKVSEVLGLMIIGGGGSALATVLFTASFREVHPSVAILLQKFQPLIVIVLAFIFLGERINLRFIKWAALALGAGIVLSFPDFDFAFLRGDFDPRSRGVALALGAAAIWATSTVAGKALLKGISPALVTGWRYLFGMLALVVYMAFADTPLPWDALMGDRVALRSVLFMATIPGLFGMFLYYQGLARTRATVATLAELVFPVTAIFLNAVWLDRPLSPVQLGAALVLLASVTRISLLDERSS